MPVLPDAVTALLRAADADSLLHDADALAAGLAEAGWAPEVESGRFGADGWDVLSSAWAPSVSVFFAGDGREVRAAALAVAAALGTGDAWGEVDTDGPEWSTWSVDDERWHTDDGLDWLEWRGRGVVVSLSTTPEISAAGGTLPAHLQLAIERADTPPEGLPRDDDRDRRIAEDGSVVERWYLVGAPDLPDELLTSLEDDPDPRVRAAADSERAMRREGTGSV